MKSFRICLIASAGVLLAFNGIHAQHVIRAVSLGDPIPAYQPDPNLMRVNGSTFVGNAVKLEFQAIGEPANACSGGCKDTIVTVACSGDCKCSAPACTVAAKAAPCKACDIVKFFHRTPATASCSTCSTTAAVSKPCSAPVACAPCAAKPVCTSDKAVPCSTCPAPTAASCSTCGPSKTVVQKAGYHRPILAAVKNLFNGTSHHVASAKVENCATCVVASSATIRPVAAPMTSASIQPIPTQSPTVLPQAISHQHPVQSTAPVPAALAPYTSPAPLVPFSTALPVADFNVPPR